MVPYLRLYLVHLWVACIAGAALIAFMALGQINLAAFIWSGLIGLAVGIPAGLLNWAYLRKDKSRRIGWDWRIADWVRSIRRT